MKKLVAQDKTGMKPTFLSNGTSMRRINLEDIVLASSDHHQCSIVMSDGTSFVVPCPLGELEETLPNHMFVRIHRQCIVNIWHIELLIGTIVLMDNGARLCVGKTFVGVLDDHICIIEGRKPNPSGN